jgi:hypothetical protein
MTEEIVDKDEVLKMARQAGLCCESNGFIDWIDAGPSLHEITAFAKLVTAKAVEREREACAKVCETALYQLQETMNELSSSEYMEQCVVQGAMNQAVKLTKAIRARNSND